MYTGKHVDLRPLQPAFIMAATGEAVTYRELEARCNRLAHLFRKRGLKRLDHYAIFMENNARYIECCSAGERAGLYYTCVNSYLTPDEVAYTRQQRVEDPDHLDGETRCRARGAERMPEGRTLHRRRRIRRERAHRWPPGSYRGTAQHTDRR